MKTGIRTIVTWLASRDVPAFALTERHAALIEAGTGARVIVATNEEQFVAALPQKYSGRRLRWSAPYFTGVFIADYRKRNGSLLCAFIFLKSGHCRALQVVANGSGAGVE